MIHNKHIEELYEEKVYYSCICLVYIIISIFGCFIVEDTLSCCMVSVATITCFIIKIASINAIIKLKKAYEDLMTAYTTLQNTKSEN